MVVPRDNVVMASCMFVCLCGTILSGSMTVLTHHDINDSIFLSLFVGLTSSTKWFVEWMLVSDFKALPPQYGYTAPKLNYFELIGYAYNDMDTASTQGLDGWYFNFLPMVAVGFTMRVITLACLHVMDRRKMNKAGVDEMFKTCMFGDMIWLIFMVITPCVACLGFTYMSILRVGLFDIDA